MAKTTRYLLGALMVTGLAGAARMAEAARQIPSTGSSHVRSTNPAIGVLIVQATEQSTTFRNMVEILNASDSFVYVEEGTCGRGVRACFMDVTLAGGHRFLWVMIDVRKADWDLMGSIGHELRHTIEVLGARAVTSRAAMFLFYRREASIGTTGPYETVGAVKAGDAVRAEVREFRRAEQLATSHLFAVLAAATLWRASSPA